MFIWVTSHVKNTSQETKGGNLKKLDILLVTKWVKEAWEKISSETVIKSFKKCCISNELDGADDDVLFSDCKEDSPNMDTDMGADIYDGVLTTEKEFYELFGYSDSESDFEKF